MHDVSQDEQTNKRPQTQQNTNARQRMKIKMAARPKVRVYSNQDEMSQNGNTTTADMQNFFGGMGSSNNWEDLVVIDNDKPSVTDDDQLSEAGQQAIGNRHGPDNKKGKIGHRLTYSDDAPI